MTTRPIEIHLTAKVADTDYATFTLEWITRGLAAAHRLSGGLRPKSMLQMETQERIDNYTTASRAFSLDGVLEAVTSTSRPYNLKVGHTKRFLYDPVYLEVPCLPSTRITEDGEFVHEDSGWVAFQLYMRPETLAGAEDDWIAFLGECIERFEGTFGNVSDDNQSFRTAFELATSNQTPDDLPFSGDRLRGYSWVTGLNARHVAYLQSVGVDVQKSDAFSSAVPLPSGGLVLRATPTFGQYDQQSMERVAEVLEPVLLPGVTKKLFMGYDHLRVVYGMDTTANAF